MKLFKRHKTAEQLREMETKKSLDAIKFLMTAMYIKAINEGRKPTRLELLEEVRTTLEGWLKMFQGPSLERQTDNDRVVVHFNKREDAQDFTDVFEDYGASVGKGNEAYVPMDNVGTCYDTMKMASEKTREEYHVEKAKPARQRNRVYKPKAYQRTPSRFYSTPASQAQMSLLKKLTRPEGGRGPTIPPEEVEGLGDNPSVGAVHDLLNKYDINSFDALTSNPNEGANRLREQLEKRGVKTFDCDNGARFAVESKDIAMVQALAKKCYSGDPRDLKIAVADTEKAKASTTTVEESALNKKQPVQERNQKTTAAQVR